MYTLGDRVDRRFPCVACHRTIWLAGNSGLQRQWSARPSRSCLTKLEGRREVCVDDSVSPTGVMDAAEHGDIWSIGGLFHSDSKWLPFAAIKQDRVYRRLKESYLKISKQTGWPDARHVIKCLPGYDLPDFNVLFEGVDAWIKVFEVRNLLQDLTLSRT